MTRGRRAVAAAAAGVAGVGWFAAAAWLDPARSGRGLPSCPFRALTGLDCPGCGSTRALAALAHGDLGAAFDHNLLVPFAVVAVAVAWAAWVAAVWQGRVVAAPGGRWTSAAAGMVLVGFAVLRNLSPFSYLASSLT